jgi:hypothetical protein
MSTNAILFIGIFTAALCVLFVFVSFHEIRTTPPGVTVVHGLLPVTAENTSPLDTPAPRPLKVLVAVDGSPCSDRAVQSVAMRPWPPGSEVEIVSVPSHASARDARRSPVHDGGRPRRRARGRADPGAAASPAGPGVSGRQAWPDGEEQRTGRESGGGHSRRGGTLGRGSRRRGIAWIRTGQTSRTRLGLAGRCAACRLLGRNRAVSPRRPVMSGLDDLSVDPGRRRERPDAEAG